MYRDLAIRSTFSAHPILACHANVPVCGLPDQGLKRQKNATLMQMVALPARSRFSPSSAGKIAMAVKEKIVP